MLLEAFEIPSDLPSRAFINAAGHERLVQQAFDSIPAHMHREWLEDRGIFITSHFDDLNMLVFNELDNMSEIDLLTL